MSVNIFKWYLVWTADDMGQCLCYDNDGLSQRCLLKSWKRKDRCRERSELNIPNLKEYFT